ncbi:hypothetical protein EUTSA_v10027423mg, partial [Eutrema salsugineum]
DTSNRFSIPAGIPSSAAPSYADRFKSSLRNLRKISSPSYQEDGTLVIKAPASILLQVANQWKGHIVAHFHGLASPPGKIFTDLSPVWRKFEKITVHSASKTTSLIFIPSLLTREWVLRTGYWQAGNCSFTVSEWTPDGSFQTQDLETAPTWALLKSVPWILYSLDSISIIASVIGDPLHTEKLRLESYRYGNTKVKMEINLDSSPPKTVIVKDCVGNTVSIEIEYPRLPPKCTNCGNFGHLVNRCPHLVMKILLKDIHPKEVAVANTKIFLASPPLDSLMVNTILASPPEVISLDTSITTEPPKRAGGLVDSDISVRSRSRSRSRSRQRALSSPLK